MGMRLSIAMTAAACTVRYVNNLYKDYIRKDVGSKVVIAWLHGAWDATAIYYLAKLLALSSMSLQQNELHCYNRRSLDYI